MGRTAKGTVLNIGGVWHAKWTLPKGKRSPWTAVNATDEASARLESARLAPKVYRTALTGTVVETVADYAERWCAWRASKGLGCVDGDRVALERHILPAIGSRDVTTIARDDLKRLVTELDTKAATGQSIDGKPFAWKTAVNAWGVARALFRDAQRAKDVSLCVRPDNPADGVSGPDTGPRKAKAYLWPSEFLTLVTSEAVPVRWQRLFALAVYSYMRAGELAALRWEDVDLEHGTIHVHQSDDRVRKKGIKATKSETARRIPIEPELAPLLEAMRRESEGAGRVFHMPSAGVLSHKLKHYLKRAGVERPDLFASDATRKAITFHDLRATGITWMAARGDDPLRIMQRAGHEDFETTKIYLREAENLSKAFGTVFPSLPDWILSRNRTGRNRSGGTSQKQGVSSGADGNRKASDNLHDLPANKPLAGGESRGQSSGLIAVRQQLTDRSRGTEKEPTDAELERAIVDAVTMGIGDVARTLAVRLEERRRASAGNVVAIAARRA